MKTINSWKDLKISWVAGKDRFMVRVAPLAMTPDRRFFKSKTDAVAFAQDSFNRWSDPNYASAIAAPEHKLKIVFACRTGIRQGEMLALKIFDKKKPLEGGIDFASNKVLIRKAAKQGLKRSDRYIGDPKSVSGIRTIPIDAGLSDELKTYWDALSKRMKGGGFLFPSRDGTMLDGTNLRERVL
ncbi:MAG TPA: hypothetical protein EYQ26_10850, partial [Rhodospirillales bacterium]|nr:hypothetical protein [Rhodospirillales bacterium]